MRKNHSKIVCIKLVHVPYLYVYIRCTVTLTSNNGYFVWRPIHTYDHISPSSS